MSATDRTPARVMRLRAARDAALRGNDEVLVRRLNGALAEAERHAAHDLYRRERLALLRSGSAGPTGTVTPLRAMLHG